MKTVERIASVCCILFSSLASADEILLTNGNKLDGTILSDEDSGVKIELKKGVTLFVARDRISSVDRTPLPEKNTQRDHNNSSSRVESSAHSSSSITQNERPRTIQEESGFRLFGASLILVACVCSVALFACVCLAALGIVSGRKRRGSTRRVRVSIVTLPIYLVLFLFKFIWLVARVVGNTISRSANFLFSGSWNSSDTVISNLRRQIPSDVKRTVWVRDGGCCVLCGSNVNIHYDHDVPVSKGGSNDVKNIRLLCQQCNLRKGARIE